MSTTGVIQSIEYSSVAAMAAAAGPRANNRQALIASQILPRMFERVITVEEFWSILPEKTEDESSHAPSKVILSMTVGGPGRLSRGVNSCGEMTT